jgi:Secretion system C-terminal sorting domain
MKAKPASLNTRILLIFIYLLSMSNIVVAKGTLIFTQKNGQQTSYVLTSVKKLTFSSGKIEIAKSDGSKDDYVLNDLQLLSFNSKADEILNSELSGESKLSLFPNPVSDILKIDYLIANNSLICLEILDINGQIILQQSKLSQPGLNELSLDVTKLFSGLYICRIKEKGRVQTSKFVKSNAN